MIYGFLFLVYRSCSTVRISNWKSSISFLSNYWFSSDPSSNHSQQIIYGLETDLNWIDN
ncbi:hypothetical protein HanRHA438_Chr14g0635001 [Helianthus annuus]|uniref:Uncharacterized protein n=1 Tax=Helianthus annuus TaxID=4232 RepID=A0A251SG19_HELAN|nr:hypothetical protein HanXRQr2_Chr14g0625011 [Helianthus annuus]KAJ0463040.1 hypothetical protein HanHA300_Chr14g0510741 [Helianthus annuus]KAJ0466842.1 hypothetical protein HanIR_Chr14g0676621 [Helianthus annuus]KAJ0484402.1 hypothetical protein HanHA89_Chr14g0543691 [Helianthus annuus]KAJ0654954.1 hypothetical protein HanLR1_Chr14g0512951 [Helianthus annuus]